MKKLILGFIVIFSFGVNTYGQNKEISIFKNENEICILLKNDKGIFDENYIFQSDNLKEFSLDKIVTANYKLFYDGKNLIFNLSNETYQLTINDQIKGENIIKGYGLSRRYGVFNINNIDSGISFFNSVIEINSKLYDSPSLKCTSGGQGASQCSTESGVGSINTGCSVTCDKGYYACCDDNITVCKCEKNTKKVLDEGRFNLIMNPTKTNIEFDGKDHEKYLISIYSISGNLMLDKMILKKNINIDNLKTDIYFYHIYDNNGYNQQGKIIKK